MAVDTENIVPLTADMTGPEFIGLLNANLSLAAQSGGNMDSTEQEQPPGIEKTIHLLLQLGLIAVEDKGNMYGSGNFYVRHGGYIECARNKGYGPYSSFKKYCHTVLMVGIENCKIKDIKVNTGETLTILYYDSNCEYKGYKSGANVLTVINSIYDLPEEDRCYIKIRLYKSTNYTVLRQLEVTVEGTYTLIKNKTPFAGMMHYFSYATGYPSKAEAKTTANGLYLGTVDNEGKNSDIVCIDNAYIALPPNYSQEGVPVPLIVWCHGTGGFKWNNQENATKKVVRSRKFLTNNGYAVCDWCGFTDNHLDAAFKGDSRYLPSAASCMAGLLEFIQMNYNVETDGIYVTGKSAGGFACMFLPQIFNVKAAAGLSPTTSSFMQLHPNGSIANDDVDTYTLYRNALLEQHDVTEIEDTEEPNTGISNIHSYNAYLNVSKLKRYDPFFKSANITTEELQTFIKYYYKSGITQLDDFIKGAKEAANGSTNVNITGNITQQEGLEIKNIVNKIKITINCPIKIWQSAGDKSVSCTMSEMFIEWCKRGGTPAYFRKLNATYVQNSNDKHIKDHNLVDEINEEDGNTNGIQMVYHTKYGGDAIETVAICEMVDWFNQW